MENWQEDEMLAASYLTFPDVFSAFEAYLKSNES